MRLRRQKSRQDQIADAVRGFLRPGEPSSAAGRARKATRESAAYQAATRGPILRRLPLVAAAAGAVAFVVSRALKGDGGAAAA
jgi:hypothetical protein